MNTFPNEIIEVGNKFKKPELSNGTLEKSVRENAEIKENPTHNEMSGKRPNEGVPHVTVNIYIIKTGIRTRDD